MKKQKLASLLVLILMLGLIVTPVFAQNYLFRVDKADVNFYINKDGTVSAEYTYQFTCDPAGHVIEYVDIGTPTNDYDLGSVTAEVNGHKVTDITKSDQIPQGVAVGLGQYSIQPGQSGTVYVWIPVIRKAIHPASGSGSKPDYASVQLEPNFFGSQYVEGNTDLAVTLILPPGMNTDQPIYYPPQNWPGNSQPQSGINKDNRVYYTWQSANANSSTEYIFGAGFPANLVPAAAIVKPSSSININTGNLGNYLCCIAFAALFGGIIWASVWGSRRRKLQYLPPKISMEGHGIKRGLTAVETAILMEQPMDKVMTMILFSTVKKGAARVINRDPLKLQVANPLPEGMYPYETDFLQAFATDDPRQRRKKLQDVMVGLVKGVTEKMRGFSRKETIDYYKSVLDQAWKQVEEAQTPEVKSQKYEEVADWTMLDQRYPERTRGAFGTGPVFVPMWWGNWDPTFRGAGGGLGSGGARTSGGSGSGGGGINMPTLPGADFAASMVNSVQAFSAGVIGDLAAFTGGVSNVTNPPPPPPPHSSYRGGGGGGGCACACACAGCACACAGGGR